MFFQQTFKILPNVFEKCLTSVRLSAYLSAQALIFVNMHLKPRHLYILLSHYDMFPMEDGML